MWQINNAKAAESIVTSVLKKLSYLSGKAVIAIIAIIGQLFALDRSQ